MIWVTENAQANEVQLTNQELCKPFPLQCPWPSHSSLNVRSFPSSQGWPSRNGWYMHLPSRPHRLKWPEPRGEEQKKRERKKIKQWSNELKSRARRHRAHSAITRLTFRFVALTIWRTVAIAFQFLWTKAETQNKITEWRRRDGKPKKRTREWWPQTRHEHPKMEKTNEHENKKREHDKQSNSSKHIISRRQSQKSDQWVATKSKTSSRIQIEHIQVRAAAAKTTLTMKRRTTKRKERIVSTLHKPNRLVNKKTTLWQTSMQRENRPTSKQDKRKFMVQDEKTKM